MDMGGELLPGNFSSIGRATSSALDLMRSHCDLGDASHQAPKAHGSPMSPTSPASMASPKAFGSSSGPSPTGGMSLTASFGLNNERASGDDDLGKTMAGLGHSPTSPMSPSRPSPAFTSMGMQAERYCDASRTKNGRWAFPSKLEQRPEVGRYRTEHGDPGTAALMASYPEWEFGLRPKTESRKEDWNVAQNQKDPFGTQDIFGASFSSMYEANRSASLEQMGLKEERRPLHKSCGRTWRDELSMLESPEHAKAWHLHDTPSSKLWRQPEWNQAKHSTEHKTEVISNYYEPQKYTVRWSSVQPRAKTGPAMDRSLRRATSDFSINSGQMGHNAPKANLHKDDKDNKKKPMVQDRSLYRNCPHTNARATNVNDFSKELARPPLMKFVAAYHDEDDPEIDAEVLNRQLTFDAIHADHAVIPRHDHAPAIGHSLTRDRAGRGARLFQGDQGMRASKGFFLPEAEHQLTSSVEKTKEPPMARTRADIGVAFDQVRGRKEPSKITSKEYGHLQQLKDAPFEFSRKAPGRGFDTRVTVSQPLAVQKLEFQSSRTHVASPSWAADSFDDAEEQPPPGMKRPGTGG